MHRRLFFVLALAGVLPPATAAAPSGAPDVSPWQRLRGGGAIVLMRHAATDPGIGDPPGFKLGNCATQRNLSAAGRRDARAIGAAFRRHDIVPGAVWSSRWCRCLETARLAFGSVQPEPALDSLFTAGERLSHARLRDLHTRLRARTETTPLVLVTHDVNIRALTGEALAPGEMLLTTLRDGKLVPLGRLDLTAEGADPAASAVRRPVAGSAATAATVAQTPCPARG